MTVVESSEAPDEEDEEQAPVPELRPEQPTGMIGNLRNYLTPTKATTLGMLGLGFGVSLFNPSLGVGIGASAFLADSVYEANKAVREEHGVGIIGLARKKDIFDVGAEVARTLVDVTLRTWTFGLVGLGPKKPEYTIRENEIGM